MFSETHVPKEGLLPSRLSSVATRVPGPFETLTCALDRTFHGMSVEHTVKAWPQGNAYKVKAPSLDGEIPKL